MGKYAEALGIIEIPVKTITFRIKPTKGDNLKFLELQKAYAKDVDRFSQEFIKYFASIVAREEGIDKNSAEYTDLETFIEFNSDDIMRKVIVSFGWSTDEKLKEAEERALKNFQVAPTT